MKKVGVLIPTMKRRHALSITLTSLFFQNYTDFDVYISNQDETFQKVLDDQHIETVCRLLKAKGHRIYHYTNLPSRGMAQQRQFLLDKANEPYVLYLDDDLVLEPYVIQGMIDVMQKETIGFVGRAPIGLSFQTDYRPQEQHIEVWKSRITPERIIPKSKKWRRYKLHNAANVLHVQNKLNATETNLIKYKVAWIGGCTLYDKKKLISSGGFQFWKSLPSEHSGEDALAQINVMETYGGCGLLPSGVYHQELKTTIPNRKINAPEILYK